jgi:uncharacterized protein (DUF1800 family)
MPPASLLWDAAGRWAAYEPDDRESWDLRRVVHLHRRAGFAATWAELQRDLAAGPGPSIDRLLSGQARAGGVPDEFARTADLLATRAVESNDPQRLKAWWVYRMAHGPDPLGERLTLLWHNHFATSNAKVNDVAAMRRQNDLFRRLARGPFGELLDAAVRDPALLVWLDAPANRKGRPNENLARELMELFTLGVGPYTEADVKEAARALTGWKVGQGAFRDWPPDHDDGAKTILGRTGPWTGADLVRMLLDHPATARRLAGQVCELLMGEGAVDAAALDALAAGLRAHDLDIGWAVGTVLRSRAFFADGNIGTRVAGPAEYVVGVARAVEPSEPPSTMLLAEWVARLGQDLFYPPNVGGWPGGRAWLSTQAVVGRANFAAALVAGQLSARPASLDAAALPARHGRGGDLDDVLSFYAELLTGRPPEPAWRRRLLAALGPAARRPDAAAVAVALIAAAPEAQLA